MAGRSLEVMRVMQSGGEAKIIWGLARKACADMRDTLMVVGERCVIAVCRALCGGGNGGFMAYN